MSITRKLALCYMKKQKRRSALTIFGVVMAVALVTAIGLFFSSVMGMIRADAEYSVGSHHFSVDGLTGQEQDTLVASPYIESYGRMRSNSFLLLEQEEGVQTLCILEERDKNAFDLLKVDLMEGRLPENSGECLLSDRAWQKMDPRPELGDVVTLPVGKQLTYGGEIEQVGERTFTVVGICDRNYNTIALTVLSDPAENTLLLRVKGFGEKHMLLRRALDECGIEKDYSSNNSYLRSTFEGGSEGMRLALSSTFLLLCIIILTAMILVIRNSFAMSLAEKITEFGILRCVGATPKQIRSVMYTEAMIIWCIGLPLGLLLGIIAMTIVFAIVNTIELEMLKYLTLVVKVWPFLITAVLSFLAVMLSARAPAKKAGRISPIEAVRGSILFCDDSKRKTRRTIKHPIFGFPGLMARRNIRRNRKRYRVTAMSIVVSMTLFVGLTGFASAVSDAFGTMGGLDSVDYQATGINSEEQALETFAAEFDEETDIIARRALIYACYFELESIDEVTAELSTHSVEVICIDEETYSQLELPKTAPSYAELVASGGAILCQTAVDSDPDTGLQYLKCADYTVGDTVPLKESLTVYAVGVDDIQKEVLLAENEIALSVEAVMEYPAWFDPYGGILLYLPGETAESIAYSEEFIKAYEENRSEPAPKNLLERGRGYLYLQAKDGKQDALSKRAYEIVRELGYEDELNTYDLYASFKEVRNTAVVVNIFVYGFMAVVVLICLVNICNTISTNIHARARELAMLRATGMSRRQFRRMLFLECLLYSIGGAVLGGLIGALIYRLLCYTMSYAFDLRSVNLPLYILIGFVGTILVAYLSGLIPLHGKLKKPIVEDIRATE